MKGKLLILLGAALIVLSLLPSCAALLQPDSPQGLFLVKTGLREATYQAVKEEPSAGQWAAGLAAVVRVAASDEAEGEETDRLRAVVRDFAAATWPEEPGRRLLLEEILADALTIYGGGVTEATWRPLLLTVAEALEAGVDAARLDREREEIAAGVASGGDPPPIGAWLWMGLGLLACLGLPWAGAGDWTLDGPATV